MKRLNFKNILRGAVIFIAPLLNTVSSIAQNKPDTIYFDQKWKTTGREVAAYYRVVIKDLPAYKVTDHFINGTVQMTGSYPSLQPEVKEGYFKYYYDDGNIEDEGLYKNDRRESLWKSYYSSGQLSSTQGYKNGRIDSEFTTFYMNGKVKRHEEYKDSVMIKGTCFDEAGKEVKYYAYQQMPKFQGDLYKYLGENLHYPSNERNAGITGIVYIKFVVEKDGSISNVEIPRGVAGGPGLDKEAVRVVSAMPKWYPGLQDGAPVRVSYSIPIHFELQ
ncbi:MAG TPA: TonB family protein [Bacteroidia bacterium]|jgi:protein TonB|nr:TonB family protein [Bacteroidia bacterium]